LFFMGLWILNKGKSENNMDNLGGAVA
jgi:hypothetical protein